MDLFMVGGDSGVIGNFSAPYAFVKSKGLGGGVAGKGKGKGKGGNKGGLDLTLSNQNKKNAQKYYLNMKKNAYM
jgi:hypothetical protein